MAETESLKVTIEVVFPLDQVRNAHTVNEVGRGRQSSHDFRVIA